MTEAYQVVDLFAGPGGLAEGFSSVIRKSNRFFEIALSVEMEAAAHSTLTLRTFTRQFPPLDLPEAYYRFVADEITLDELKSEFPQEWEAAQSEALRLELGSSMATEELIPRIDAIRDRSCGRTVLIGGPPCQAYSLVGRSRNAGITGYVPEDDGRHFLYREYIRVLDRLRPAAFVMENVKGILSSTVAGGQIFERILDDLGNVGREEGGYSLVALTAPVENLDQSGQTPQAKDFIVRAEQFGVPQARHRVFIVGLRADIAAKASLSGNVPLRSPGKAVSVRDVIGGIPPLRSGLSRGDECDIWREAVLGAASELMDLSKVRAAAEALDNLYKVLKPLKARMSKANWRLSRSSREYRIEELSSGMSKELREFLVDDRLSKLAHHETRGHMKRDLARYLFASVFAEANARPPKSTDFPEQLAPDHRSWRSGKFADRFRVQMWDRPATTVTSHISKDGHYYIHPDPAQCRSLTVREAARLQTFPDNYLFLGNRTQQYVQVGNAVPPFLARQIASALARALP